MDFAQALLDHTRSSYELEVMLNHNPSGTMIESAGERMHLHRLKLAIKYRQKKVRIVYSSRGLSKISFNT
jgi:transient receptor potential cation channel subfamily C